MEYNDFLNHLKESENLRSFAKRIKYFDQLLPRIGSGSGRVVYDIDGSKVLKLAKNPKGISQNEVETGISAYEYNHDIVTIVFKYDENDIWLIAEKANKITPKRFKEVLGFDINNAYSYLNNRLADNRTKHYIQDIDPEIKSILDEDEWMDDIFRMIQDHDIKIGDFSRISSFGEVIRYGQPAIVVIDYGLSDEVYNTHYKRSLGIYEMYNDQDGNDDILTDDNFNTSNVEIMNGGAGATPTPETVEERVLSSMTGSSSVVVKDKCRLGGGETCNQGDIKNLNIKSLNEDLSVTTFPAKYMEGGEDVDDLERLYNRQELGVTPDRPFNDNDRIIKMKWAAGVDLTTPIHVNFYHDGGVLFNDGHHRVLAARILNKDVNIIIDNNRLKPEIFKEYIDRIKRGYSPIEINPDRRNLNYIENYKIPSVEILEKARKLGIYTHGTREDLFSFYDEENNKENNISEEVDANEVDDVLGTINTIRSNKREVGFLGYIPQNYFKLINQSDIGLLPVDQGNNKIGYILYKNKKKALSLNNYLKAKGGYAKDDTPEEARILGKLLDYSDKTIEEYIKRKYKTQPIQVDTRTAVDFNDLDENIMNEVEILGLSDLPFTDDINNIGGKIFSVGGAVRDKFLGKQSKDLDILITGVDMQTIEQILSKYGKVDAVGKSFGILKFKPQGSTEDIDVAIPRTEVPTDDGGHKGFEVTSDHTLPIEDDLFRRDFTINAIAQDIDGNIIDPYHGIDDLNNKIIRIVNPEAFSDDPLRMLRAIQFSARFGFTIEPKTMQMIKTNAGRIKEIPPERILGEFDKIVQKGDPIKGISVMVASGIYKSVFGVDFYKVNIPKNKLSNISNMGEFIFVLTYKNIDQPAEFFKNNLKGDIDNYKLIKALELSYTATDSNPTAMRMIAHNMFLTSPQSLSSKLIDDKVVGGCNDLLSGKYPKTVNELAVNGGDLMSLGLKGKEIGDMQKSLLIKIYADKIQNNKEAILAVVGNKEVEEGVGDKYAEKRFGIPDENDEFEQKYATAVLNKTEQPIAYIQNLKGFANNKPPTTAVFKNPKSLNNFGMNVRAIGDIKGNLYVAATDNDFDHGKMAYSLGFVNNSINIYGDNNFVLLHRIGNSNNFGLADSSYDFFNEGDSERILELLKLLKMKNSQYEYYPMYFASIYSEKTQPISINENILIKKS